MIPSAATAPPASHRIRTMEIRALRPEEHDAWLSLREELWPDLSRDDLRWELFDVLADRTRNHTLVAVDGKGGLVGFVEVSMREWAEGCTTHPVGYIEAWYVRSACHRQGIGRRLVEAAEDWARSRGCLEMGSDADLSNEISHRAHGALGYSEVGRAVLFSKKLAP
ncbi:MAG TPA: GNAT family N-acetyltransferase [Phycisphaerae bacterium]|nr:GNAT family N-acetyltransferase [Phycisphaerae bacterium]